MSKRSLDGQPKMEGWAMLLQEELRSWTSGERCGSIVAASSSTNETRGVALVANAALGVACCWHIGESLPHRTVAIRSTETGEQSSMVLVAGEIGAAAIGNDVILFHSSDSSRWSCRLMARGCAQMAVWADNVLVVATAAGELWSVGWGIRDAERLGGTEVGFAVDALSEQASRQRGMGFIGLTLGAVRAVGSFSARKLRLGQRGDLNDNDFAQTEHQPHHVILSSSACALDYHKQGGYLLYARGDGVAQLWQNGRGVCAVYESRSDGFRFSGEARLLRVDDAVAIMVAIEQHSERNEQRIITMSGQIGPCRTDPRSIVKARFSPPLILQSVEIGNQLYPSLVAWTRLRLLEMNTNKTTGWLLDASGSVVAPVRLSLASGRLAVGRARRLDSVSFLDAAPQRGGLLLLETGGTTRVLSARELVTDNFYDNDDLDDQTLAIEDDDETIRTITGAPLDAVERLVEACRSLEGDPIDVIVIALRALALKGRKKGIQLALIAEASRRITDAAPRSGLVAESGELALARLEAKCQSHGRLVAALSAQGETYATAIVRIAQHAECLASARYLCEQHAILSQQDRPEPLTASCRKVVASTFDPSALSAAGLSALDAYYGQPPALCLDALYLILEDGGIELVRLAAEILVAGRDAMSATLVALLSEGQSDLPPLGANAARLLVTALSRLKVILVAHLNKKTSGGSRSIDQRSSRELNDTYSELAFCLASLARHADCDEFAARVSFLSAKAYANDGDTATFRTQTERVLEMCRNRTLRHVLIDVCLDTEAIAAGMGLRQLRLSASADPQLAQLALTMLTCRGRFADALDLAPLAQDKSALSSSKFVWLENLNDRQYTRAKHAMPMNARSLDSMRALAAYAADDTRIEPQFERRLKQAELTRALGAAGAHISISEEKDDDEYAYVIFDAAMSLIESSGSRPIEERLSLLRLAASARTDLSPNNVRKDDAVTPLARLWAAAAKADATTWVDAVITDFGGLVVSPALRRTTFFAFASASPEGSSPNDLERGLYVAGFDSDILPRLTNLLLASYKRATDDHAALSTARSS